MAFAGIKTCRATQPEDQEQVKNNMRRFRNDKKYVTELAKLLFGDPNLHERPNIQQQHGIDTWDQ